MKATGYTALAANRKRNDYFAATGSMLTRLPPRSKRTLPSTSAKWCNRAEADIFTRQNFVPRWRTMMLRHDRFAAEPFTPSRLLTLSRHSYAACPFL